MIVTEMAVIQLSPRGFLLTEIAADTTLDAVKAATGAPIHVADEVKTFG
jgi:acyl CoA:acetate/3-ketoacid CoA transferase beta subunit